MAAAVVGSGVVNQVNAAFELIGTLLAWRSVVEVQRAPARGVYWPMVAFSGLWAAECLPYYLAHGDKTSAVLAAFRCLGLGVWTYLVLTDRRDHPKHNTCADLLSQTGDLAITTNKGQREAAQ